MNFSEQLNDYIEKLHCTSKELSLRSGISASAISRFRNGKRQPNLKNSQLDKLADGLSQIAGEKQIDLSKEAIYSALLSTLDNAIDIEQLRKNFDEMVTALNITTNTLAARIGFSPSLISKIRSGQRNPFNIQEFAIGVSSYVAETLTGEEDLKNVASFINCRPDDLSDDNIYREKVLNWLLYNSSPVENVSNFLNSMDDFDLDKYIKVIHFDEMKVPQIPFYKTISKNYYGLQEMKQGELDFFKSTVLSKSTAPVFMCSDMPMSDMGEDVDFGKKWMYAVAISLKKGLHFHVVHNLNRPFKELMLGLESWIPLYMTGQISPYYLKNFKDNTYCHLTYTSGSVALAGECIKGFHSKGKYRLYSGKTDVEYYRQKAEQLLKVAYPLMEIYRVEEKDSFADFALAASRMQGNRRRILASLPLHTLSETLLLKILRRNQIPEDRMDEIVKAQKNEAAYMNTFLKDNLFSDEIEELSEEEFMKQPPLLFLANSFYENKISYNYDEYLEHLALTKEYVKHAPNYTLTTASSHTFKNIQIVIHEDSFVMISKNTNPAIHFVIRHPKLIEAISKFRPPVIE